MQNFASRPLRIKSERKYEGGAGVGELKWQMVGADSAERPLPGARSSEARDTSGYTNRGGGGGGGGYYGGTGLGRRSYKWLFVPWLAVRGMPFVEILMLN